MDVERAVYAAGYIYTGIYGNTNICLYTLVNILFKLKLYRFFT